MLFGLPTKKAPNIFQARTCWTRSMRLLMVNDAHAWMEQVSADSFSLLFYCMGWRWPITTFDRIFIQYPPSGSDSGVAQLAWLSDHFSTPSLKKREVLSAKVFPLASLAAWFYPHLLRERVEVMIAMVSSAHDWKSGGRWIQPCLGGFAYFFFLLFFVCLWG